MVAFHSHNMNHNIHTLFTSIRQRILKTSSTDAYGICNLDTTISSPNTASDLKQSMTQNCRIKVTVFESKSIQPASGGKEKIIFLVILSSSLQRWDMRSLPAFWGMSQYFKSFLAKYLHEECDKFWRCWTKSTFIVSIFRWLYFLIHCQGIIMLRS